MTDVQHLVFIWLKERNNKTHIAELNTALEGLRSISGVKEVLFGPKANPGWEVPDEDFHYGLTVTFESIDAVKVYYPHPIHQKAIQVVMGHSAKVLGGYFDVAG